MAAEDMLKIAGDLRKTSLEENRNCFGGLNDATDEKNEELRNFSGTVLMENTPPVVDDAKTAIPVVEPQIVPTVAPMVDNVAEDAVKNDENAEEKIVKKQREEERERERLAKSEAENKTENIVEPTVIVENINPREKESLETLNRARKEFVEMDYKKTKMWDSVNRYFKKSKLEIKETRIVELEGVEDDGSKKMGTVADDNDVVYMQALYDNALINYKNERIEGIQKRGLSENELKNELKNLTIEIGKLEREALLDEKNEIRGRELQGTTIEAGKNIFQKSVGWYRQLGWKKQLAISVGLISGTGAAAIGAAAGIAGGATIASCFAAATLGRRIIGGSSMGVTAFGVAEGGASLLRDMASKKETSSTSKEFLDEEILRLRVKNDELENITDDKRAEILSRELSTDERFSIIKSRLNDIAFKSNDNVDTQKINTLLRAGGATFFGVLMGSGILTHWISEKLGLDEKIKLLLEKGRHTQLGQMIIEKIGIEDISVSTNTSNIKSVNAKPFDINNVDPREGAVSSAHPMNTVFDKNNVYAPDAATPNTNALNHSNVAHASVVLQEHAQAKELTETLTINKGSSFEGTLMKYLGDPAHRENILKYKPEWSKLSNAVIADRMAIEFAHAHEEMHGHLPDYVQAGAKLNISFDGPRGLSMEISDKDYGWYEEVKTPATDNSIEKDDIPKAGSEIAPTESKVVPTVSDIAARTSVVEDLGNRVNVLENHEDLVHGEAVEKIISSQDKLQSLNSDYDKAMDNVDKDTIGDSAWDGLIKKAGAIDGERDGLIKFLKDVADSDKNAAQTLRSMRQNIVGSDSVSWKNLENMKMSDILKKDNFDKLPKTGKNIIDYFQKDMKMSFHSGETMKDWTRRVVVSTERMLAASKK